MIDMSLGYEISREVSCLMVGSLILALCETQMAGSTFQVMEQHRWEREPRFAPSTGDTFHITEGFMHC